MKQYRNFALFLTFFLTVFSLLSVSGVHAVSLHSAQTVALAGKQNACEGLSQVGGACGTGQSDIGGVLKGVVEIISYIAGIIAVAMIIISGIRFITSSGDSAKVATAKTALVYALIGVAVAGLAQIFIHVVLSTASGF